MKHKLVDSFKPELLNRFDGIIAFRQLNQAEIARVVELNLQSFAKQVLDAHGITLSFSDDVIERIAGLGYDPVFGARPLRGVISTKIKDPLAREILEAKAQRNDVVNVSLQQDEFVFEKIA